MNELTTQIPTADGQMETFVVSPDRQEPAPAVLLYMDAPGIREELRDFARRIAGHGYCVLLPDLYYRRGRVRFERADLARPEGRRAMFDAMYSLSNERVMHDTEAMLRYLAAQPQVAQGPKGCIGYCMSGQFVVSAAGTFPREIVAAASLYGVGIVTDQPDSPHRLAEHVHGELYLGFAERDEYVPETVIPTLREALERHGVSHCIEVWPGTQHGFCFPERTGIYVESAAEQVWQRVFDLYKRRLG